MPATSESALLLANQLRSSTDDELRDILTERAVRATGIKDFFDLADALLDEASVDAALSALDRPTLAALAALSKLGAGTAAEVSAELTRLGGVADRAPEAIELGVRLGLVVRSGDLASAVSTVARQLAAWPERGLPGLASLAAEPRPATVTPAIGTEAETVDTLAAERAFETTSAIVELVVSLQNESAHELARGGITLPDSKRLAASAGVGLDEVPQLIEIAERAGIVAGGTGQRFAVPAAADWLVGSASERWARLAGAWVDRLPGDIREVLAALAHAEWGDRLAQYVAWLYPAGGEQMRERVIAYGRDATLLGITANDRPSTPGAALLTDGVVAAASAMALLYPPAVNQVYLQRDLTIVAPGPLEPAIELKLRAIADLDARALATTWRVSASSLDRAFARGETTEGIREFLASISLTGLPQPLDYLLREAGSRFGLIRVSSTPGGQTRIRSMDASLLRALMVDRALNSLGFMSEASGLISRFDRDVVFFSLSDARYPVAAEDANGSVVVPARPRLGTRPMDSTDTTGAFIERLRSTSVLPVDTGDAWIARQLEVAVRGKLPLTVSVRMPDGSVSDYLLEPASVAGGRLRARDRRADLERTLPLTSIVAVAPAAE